MNDSVKPISRLLLLRVVLKCMAWFALIIIVVVAVQSMLGGTASGPGGQAAMAVSVSSQQPGQFRVVEWQGKPVLILRLQSQWLADQRSRESHLAKLLLDPDSEKSAQPDTARNVSRSPVQGWFVAVALGTGMSCPLRFEPPSQKTDPVLREPWPGGFIDTCDNSRFDLAGRVFQRQYASRNLVVPAWRLNADTGQMLIGAD